jgi:hypothetical protein
MEEHRFPPTGASGRRWRDDRLALANRSPVDPAHLKDPHHPAGVAFEPLEHTSDGFELRMRSRACWSTQSVLETSWPTNTASWGAARSASVLGVEQVHATAGPAVSSRSAPTSTGTVRAAPSVLRSLTGASPCQAAMAASIGRPAGVAGSATHQPVAAGRSYPTPRPALVYGTIQCPRPPLLAIRLGRRRPGPRPRPAIGDGAGHQDEELEPRASSTSGMRSMPAFRSLVSVLLRALGDFSLHPQGRPCGRPPAALRPGSDTTAAGEPASPTTHHVA